MSVQRGVAILLTAGSLAVAACKSESAERRAIRLSAAEAKACQADRREFEADMEAHNLDRFEKQTDEQRKRAVDSLRAVIHARCLVATRDLNAFLNGQ
jgi:hypothetical protein